MSEKLSESSIVISWLKTIFAVLVVSAGLLVNAAEDIQTLTKVCGACHGESGFSADTNIPHIAGQKPVYLAAQLKDIRDGVRKNSQMDALVKNLSNKQITDLANYYSMLPNTKKASKEINQQGKNVRARCISCHGIKGITVNEQWPNLAGQQQKYLQKQLMTFKNASRPGAIMQVIANELTDEQIKAVAEYYSQQPGR